MRSTTTLTSPRRWLLVLSLLAGLGAVLPAEAQDGPALERPSNVGQWERSAPTHMSSLQQLERLIEETDPADDDYPRLLERLAELYWQRATHHELTAHDHLQASLDAEDAGNAALADDEARKAQEARALVIEFRDKAIDARTRLVETFPDDAKLDRVLFSLALDLEQVHRAKDARSYYEQLVRDHPDSKYLGDAYLGLAEYEFMVNEDMDQAVSFYNDTIAAAPDSAAAGYAMYKKGWCHFNLGEPEKALAQFESVIEFSEGHAGRASLQKEATRELVRAWSLWEDGRASNAKEYFGKFASDGEDLNGMLERLARLYQEAGAIDKSNFIYKQLIEDNSSEFKLVGYQIEIMLNTEAMNIPDKTAAEIVRTVELLAAVRENHDRFIGYTEAQYDAYHRQLETYVRETARWYRNAARSSGNASYGALADALDEVYTEHFSEDRDD